MSKASLLRDVDAESKPFRGINVSPENRVCRWLIVVSLPRMIPFFLGFRARAMSMALVCFGLAVVAPSGLKGFVAFLQAPPGLSVVALALMALGLSVEEAGTMRRIRLGIAMRLLSVPILLAAVIWAMMLGSPLPSLATMGFVLGGLGGVGVVIALQHDWATYADVRHGQPVQLLDISPAGLEIATRGMRTSVPLEALIAVRAVANLDGRAVIFLVHEEARRQKDMDALPWIGATPEGDAFLLTEHQAGMDVEHVIAKLGEFRAERRRGAGA